MLCCPLPDQVLEILAADMACDVADFLRPENTVAPFRMLPRRRRFPASPRTFNVVTIGFGVVISVDEPRLAWAKETLGSLSPSDLISGQGMALMQARMAADGQCLYGPGPTLLCTRQSLRMPIVPDGIQIQHLEGPEITCLYEHDWLKMALSYYVEGDRPDVFAAAAYCDGALAGVAACSADCDEMYQVGIDVAAAHRGRGLGAALVATVTRWILNQNKIPYYGCGMHNIASLRLATSVGYTAAWTSLWAR